MTILDIRKSDELKKAIEKYKDICLPETMKIYLPTCYGECIDEVIRVRDEIDKITGGSTLYKEAEGCYHAVTDEGYEIHECEPVMVLETAHRCFTGDQSKKIMEILKEYGEKTNQYSIGIWQGKFYVIKTTDLARALEKKAKTPIFKIF